MKSLADGLRTFGGALVVMGVVVAASLAGAAVFFAVGVWS